MERNEFLQGYKQFYIDNYYNFVKKAFEITSSGDEFVTNWHIEYICNILQESVQRVARKEKKKYDLIINIPPRSLKSTMVSIDLPAWAWLFAPTMKFINTSHSSPLSTGHNIKTRRIVESKWYQLFSGVTLAKDQNEKSKFENNFGGIRASTSVGSSEIFGEGANIIIIDDPQSPAKANSETDRLKVISYFEETLSSRLNDPEVDIFIIVMQLLNENDLVNYLLEKEPDRWKVISIPAEIDGKVVPKNLKEKYIDGLMFPKRFGKTMLENMKKSLGSYGYSAQYLQMPTPPEGGILKKSWFYKIDASEIPNDIVWDIFLDTAYTKDKTNDPTGILIAGRDIKNMRMIIRFFGAEYLEMPDLIKRLPEIMKLNGCNLASMIYVEPKASGLSLIQLIRRETMLSITRVKSKLTSLDKISRAHFIAPYAESGRIAIIKGNWNDAYIHEITSFPKAQHDETIDTTAYACNKLLK